MKALKILLLSTIISLYLFNITACDKAKVYDCDHHEVSACSEDSSKTNIQFKNISDFDVCNVVFNKVNYGKVDKGRSTCYRSFNQSYAYGEIHFSIGDKEFGSHPIDYVGEEPLSKGNHTLVIDISNYSKGYFSINLE